MGKMPTGFLVEMSSELSFKWQIQAFLRCNILTSKNTRQEGESASRKLAVPRDSGEVIKSHTGKDLAQMQGD